ncbi:multidrug efflux pump subunit AcrA (membrane-fusion protein) [Algoriphagus iocasae]|uniref:Multidrug efflux pump subunit AcrA (Membrane-fusion protein) n=1 Tax=Algoriphagus iocasae TaxID=1836499 RepID=A0A841MXP5_9BACT|nr:efflux RND transporter periplasmic adaptor subunit [Algoriphagus iocasae]MBB6327378.1 multidrug efflux pump subunit AcrA (membrane-fusion protein) [Algoriphagus iocasae]
MKKISFEYPAYFPIAGFSFIFLFLFGCGNSDVDKITPERKAITESVYASGNIKAVNQYDAFTNASGPIQEIFVEEGDSVSIGTPLLAVYNEREKLSRESAEIAKAYSDLQANQSRLRDLQLTIDVNKSKMQNDSLLYVRQKALHDQNIGTEVEFEQRKLNWENSKTAYESALIRYQDLKREIEFNSNSASKNLAISKVLESDYVLKSKINGKVYALLKEKGEMVTPQVALAVLGSVDDFLLELQVDEYDISKIKLGQPVMVSMDSYKGESFEAVVDKIYPIMDTQTKSFKVEAKFTKAPPQLYPNLSLEANIITEVRIKAVVIPRTYLIADSLVVNENEDTLRVKVGIKNFQYAQILKGIDESTVLIKPKK